MAKNISPSSRVGLAANGGAMGGEGGVASGSEETARNGNDGGTGSPMSWAYRGDSTGEAGGRGGGNIHEGGTFAGTPGGGGGSAGGGGQTGGDGARGQAYVTWSD